MFERRWIMLAAAGCVACISASAQEWKVPQVKLPLETPVFPPRGGQHNQWYGPARLASFGTAEEPDREAHTGGPTI